MKKLLAHCKQLLAVLEAFESSDQDVVYGGLVDATRKIQCAFCKMYRTKKFEELSFSGILCLLLKQISKLYSPSQPQQTLNKSHLNQMIRNTLSIETIYNVSTNFTIIISKFDLKHK